MPPITNVDVQKAIDMVLEYPNVRMSTLALGSVEKIPNVVRDFYFLVLLTLHKKFLSVINVTKKILSVVNVKSAANPPGILRGTMQTPTHVKIKIGRH